jgi:hypothetical protein
LGWRGRRTDPITVLLRVKADLSFVTEMPSKLFYYVRDFANPSSSDRDKSED